MFPFDQSSLPQLTTRKALIVVDFQNDFLQPGGALPVTEPEGFVNRTLELAAAFRASGDVVWVQSRFEELRPADPDQILATDSLPVRPRAPRGRRPRAPPPPLPIDDTNESDADPEAFLSHADPACLKPASDGAEPPAAIKNAIAKPDLVLTKTHYSAFQGTQLLRVLRAKMVMEVFICGSLANVGVYATALGAAGHGMCITIVENCCGYRSDSRQMYAVKALLDLTGCEIASAAEVLEQITPKQPVTSKKTSKTPSKNPTPLATATLDGSRLSMSPDIVRPMTGLRLASDSPVPAATAATMASSGADGDAAVDQSKPPNVEKSSGDASDSSKEPSDKPLVKEAIIEATATTTAGATEGEGEKEGTQEEKRHEQEEKGQEQEEKEQGQEKMQGTGKEEREPEPKPEDTQRKPSEQVDVKSVPERGTTKQADLPSKTEALSSTAPDTHGVDQASDAEVTATSQKGLCAGDTDVIEELLPAELEKDAFYTLKDEIRWQRMSHQGGEVPRLVAVQGDVAEDGSMPVYRHPSDESPPLLPFSPTVLAIKAETEKHLGHPLNHVLIQYYRDGNDYISEHSDKTLDIVRGSFIANVSLGAERIMVLRTKRPDKDPSRSASSTPQATEGTKRKIQRARLPHNSLCRMGLQTNMQWLHSIRQDKRADRDKKEGELAYGGGRISLTFRQIGTFLDRDEAIIWGQGATGKTRDEAHPVINGQEPEAIRMLQAFGTENHASSFDWDAHYGAGFDVLHIRAAPRFFASGDAVVDMRIAMMLVEYGIGYAKGSMAPSSGLDNTGAGSKDADVLAIYEGPAQVKFSDNDASKSTIHGDVAIMLYIDAVYAQSQSNSVPINRSELAKRLTRFQEGLPLLSKWRRFLRTRPSVSETQSNDKKTKGDDGKQEPSLSSADPLKPLRRELAAWDLYAAEANGEFLAGPSASLPDFAVWPVLHAMVQQHGEIVWSGLDNLHKYYGRIKERERIKKLLG